MVGCCERRLLPRPGRERKRKRKRRQDGDGNCGSCGVWSDEVEKRRRPRRGDERAVLCYAMLIATKQGEVRYLKKGVTTLATTTATTTHQAQAASASARQAPGQAQVPTSVR